MNELMTYDDNRYSDTVLANVKWHSATKTAFVRPHPHRDTFQWVVTPKGGFQDGCLARLEEGEAPTLNDAMLAAAIAMKTQHTVWTVVKVTTEGETSLDVVFKERAAATVYARKWTQWARNNGCSSAVTARRVGVRDEDGVRHRVIETIV